MCDQHHCITAMKRAVVTTVNKQYGSSPLIRSMQFNGGYFKLTGGEVLFYNSVKLNGISLWCKYGEKTGHLHQRNCNGNLRNGPYIASGQWWLCDKNMQGYSLCGGHWYFHLACLWWDDLWSGWVLGKREWCMLGVIWTYNVYVSHSKKIFTYINENEVPPSLLGLILFIVYLNDLQSLYLTLQGI